MNIRKGFFRLTLVLSIIVGMISPLCLDWIFDKREVTIKVPEGWITKTTQEKLNSIDELFSSNEIIEWDDGTKTLGVLSLPKMEQWNIKRQFKRRIISERPRPEDKRVKFIGYSFSFKAEWIELSFLAFVGFVSTWFIYLFIRLVIVAFIMGGFKTK